MHEHDPHAAALGAQKLWGIQPPLWWLLQGLSGNNLTITVSIGARLLLDRLHHESIVLNQDLREILRREHYLLVTEESDQSDNPVMARQSMHAFEHAAVIAVTMLDFW